MLTLTALYKTMLLNVFFKVQFYIYSTINKYICVDIYYSWKMKHGMCMFLLLFIQNKMYVITHRYE